MRISLNYKRNLLRPTPSFQLSLSRKRLVHVVVRFPEQQTRDVVLVRESLKMMKLMLKKCAYKDCR